MRTKRINSRQKGKCGERLWRDELHAMGFLTAKRGVQHQGGTDSPDVVCADLPGVHCEVKFNVQGMDFDTVLLADALDQARKDAGEFVCAFPSGKEEDFVQRPYYVAWKPPRKPWRITYPCPKSGLLVTVTGADMKRALLMLASKDGGQ